MCRDVPCVCPGSDEEDEEIRDEHGPVDDLEVPSVEVGSEPGILLAELLIGLEGTGHARRESVGDVFSVAFRVVLS